MNRKVIIVVRLFDDNNYESYFMTDMPVNEVKEVIKEVKNLINYCDCDVSDSILTKGYRFEWIITDLEVRF